jgi:photosynthetic reaction center cytochrome c subunit
MTLILLLALAGCERPPVEPVQGGYRGTGMAQIYNPRLIEAQAPLNAEPDIARPARVRLGQPKAGAVYENLEVLGDLSVGEFGRTMSAITAWVSPEQGCLYCHEQGNFASDALYTKVVARRMLQMTQFINANWTPHVGQTGVTCYTCHRGLNVPANLWFLNPGPRNPDSLLGDRAGQNAPAPSVGLASLPNQIYSDYLLNALPIRVNGPTAMPLRGEQAHRASIKQAEHTYALMTHMSTSLGVNCTFCHNSQSFQSWEISSPQRMTAWHGIRMARSINQEYFAKDPLLSIFPPYRRGPLGDVAKIHCATCHQGAYKPLYGSHLAQYYPAVVPASLRVDSPPAPPAVKQPLPPVRGALLGTGARDPAAQPR